jgi:hypothetical protein
MSDIIVMEYYKRIVEIKEQHAYAERKAFEIFVQACVENDEESVVDVQ